MRHDQQQTVLRKLFLTFSSLKYLVVVFWICFPEAIGIEALSRGAEYAVFVEKNPKACTCIRENLSFTKLTDGGKLLNMDVLQALRSLEGGEPFDCIFMDAPYEQHLEQPVLEYLADSTLADENTLIVVEEDLHTDFSYVEDLGYRLVRSKEYKTNKHVFLKK